MLFGIPVLATSQIYVHLGMTGTNTLVKWFKQLMYPRPFCNRIPILTSVNDIPVWPTKAMLWIPLPDVGREICIAHERLSYNIDTMLK